MMRDTKHKHKHKSAWLFLLLIVVQMVIWVTAASARRPFAYTSQAQTPQPLHGRRRVAKENVGVIRRAVEGKDEINRLGSRPPSCQVKCGGCKPCEAVQVPTPTNHVGVQQQYTNYEPEGWKCRCGSVFFNP